jgi:RND family efflux transporter MFP subunit
MRNSLVRLVLLGLTGGVAAGTAACGGDAAPPVAANAAAAATVRLSPENTVTASLGEVSAGPLVSGQLTPAREAVVRAQVGGSIVALPVDVGQPVTAGAEIARIASRDLDAAFESSQAAVKSAETALAVATAELKRTENLVNGGALAARDVDQARNVVANAEAQLAAARARQRSAWQQLDDTTVRAPFGGVVTARPASLGDVVAPGTELLAVVDPSSLRLEAQVPAQDLQDVRRGARVTFTIRGVPGEHVGRVDRLGAAADPVTRQVSIFVSLPNTGGRLIAGLFAEGQVETVTRKGVVVPLAAVDETGAAPTVTRVRNGKAERLNVVLGPRQPDTERVEIASGIDAGDVLIVGSAKGVPSGTPIEVVQ